MMKEVGVVWYDRLPREVRLKGTLDSSPVNVELKELAIGIIRIRGHLITKLATESRTTKIKQVAQKSESKEDFLENCLELWKKSKKIQQEIGDGIPTDNDAVKKPVYWWVFKKLCGLGPILMMQITPLGVWLTVLLCKTYLQKLQPKNCLRGAQI